MSDAEKVARRRDEHIDGFNRQDVAAMSNTVTDDSVTMPPNQAPLIGRAAVEAWWKEGFEVANSTFTYVPQEVLIGGSWAYDRFDWTMQTELKSTGETTKDSGNCVWLWEKQDDGSWKLSRTIWNSFNPVVGIWSGSPRS